MWSRVCPLCFAKVPRTLLLTKGDELVCPSCRASLELSRFSRILSSLVGLLAGFAAVHLVLRESAHGRWALPMVGAVLGYALASALFLFFLADLIVAPKPPHDHFPHPHE